MHGRHQNYLLERVHRDLVCYGICLAFLAEAFLLYVLHVGHAECATRR